MEGKPASLEDVILQLTAQRGEAKSICPTEAARAYGGETWRKHLHEVRRTAQRLAREGRLVILRKGKPVDPDDFKGVYRLKAPDG